MKKRTLLTFAATSAVVMTTAASYAIWDQLDTVQTATITTGKGITVTSDKLNFTGGTLADSANGDTTIESELVINVDGNTVGKKLEFTTSGMTLGGSEMAGAVLVSYEENGVDVTTTGDADVKAKNTYTVKVKLPDGATSDMYAEKEITFNVKAELVGPVAP